MRKDFVNEVARTQSIKRPDLIEKDLILHQLLFDLSRKHLARNVHYSISYFLND